MLADHLNLTLRHILSFRIIIEFLITSYYCTKLRSIKIAEKRNS